MLLRGSARALAALAALLCVALIFPDAVLASTDTWSGGTSVNWNDAANWGGAVPTTGQDVLISPNTATAFAPNNLDASFTLRSVTLGASSNPNTVATGYDITTGNSSTISIQSGGFISDVSGHTGTDQINVGVNLAGSNNISVASNSNLSFGQTVAISGVVAINTNPGSTATFVQGLAGTGPVDTFGTVVFLGSSNYTGGTEITAGSLQLGNGTTSGTLTGAITVDNAAQLFFDEASGSTTTFSNAIGGQGGITQERALSTVILTGANTYSGGTTVTAGTLQLGDGTNAGVLPDNAAVSSGATLAFDEASGTTTINGVISGAGNVSQIGASGSVLEFDAAQTYTGTTTIAANTTLRLGTGGSLSSTSTAGIVDNGTFEQNNGASQTLLGPISGTGGVTIDTGSTLVVTGTNSFSGTTVINASSTFKLGDALHTGTLTGNPNITADGLFELANAGAVTYAGVISGAATGNIQIDSGNSLILANDNTFQGTLTINSNGTVRVGSNVGPATGSLSATNTSGIVDNGTLNFFDVTGGTQTIAGVISGNGNLVVGSVAPGSPAVTVVLTANNTFTGTTNIATGSTLKIGTALLGGQIQGNILDGGSFDLVNIATGSQTFTGSILGAGSVTLENNAGTFILTGAGSWTGGTSIGTGDTLQIGNGGSTGSIIGGITDNGHLTFDTTTALSLTGNITGSGDLTQNGSGTLVLQGTNTFAGPLTINSGAVELTNNGSITSDAAIGTSGTLRFNNIGAPVTYGGAISGSGNLEQSGGATLILTGDDSAFTGTTTIDGNSTLQIGDATHAITLGGSITDNGVLDLNNVSPSPFADAISGTGSVTVDEGANSVELSGTNTYTGGTDLVSGTLEITSQSNIGGVSAGPVSFANNATLQFLADGSYTPDTVLGAGGGTLDTNGHAVTWSGVITSTTGDGLTKAGTGTLILTAAETYSGDTTINGGTLQLGNGTTSGTVAGNIVDNATLDFDFNNTSAYGGAISGTGVVEQIGTGTLTLSGVNTYQGGTNVKAGGLSVSSDGNLGNGGTVALSDGTTLISTAGGSFAHALTIAGNTTVNVAQNTTTTWDGLISDGASHGALTVTGGGSFVPTNTANTYHNGTTVAGGSTIIINAAGQLGDAGGSLTLGDATTRGTLDVTSNFTLEATRTVTIGAGNATINTTAGDTFEITQAIGGAGGLTVGSGTLLLNNTNTYGGGTAISSGATLQLGDGGTPGGVVGGIVDNGALIFDEGGNASFSALISGSGSLTQNDLAAGTLTLTGADTYTGTTTITSGTLQLGDGTHAGSVAGPIVDNATLALNEPTTTILTGNISGTGGLTQMGPGTLILTGTNSYGGATLISAGTLQIGNGGTGGALTGGGPLTDNGTLAFDESGTINVGSAIGGTGSLTQIGTGTTVLTGANTYLGTTTIGAGTLQIGNGGSVGHGAVTDNGTLAFNTTSGILFANDIGGTGALNQLGTGTTVLTGNASYTGLTTISAGVLQVGNGGTAGALTGTSGVTDNATLAFDSSNAVTFSAPISGTGALVQSGSGVLTLTGANTYLGGTTVGGGGLVIGAGGTSGSITGDINDTTSLGFNRSDSTTVAGVISGAGSVTQIGTGRTVLTGADTYTGGTNIAAGTLQLGNGGTTGSIKGNVADTGTLAFDHSDSVLFAGVISGHGGVTQIGAGATTLSAANTYSGPTTVSSGTLVVTGSIASSALTVNGGTLAGTGTVGTTTINAGSISPGTSGTGTLTVAGNLVLGPNSTYDAVVTPSASDLVKVAGSATLTGGLVVTPSGTGFGATPIPILTASAGLTGKFTSFSVVAPPSSQIPILTYDADDAFLSFVPSVTTLLPTSSANTNQSRVAAAIDFALSHDGAQDFIAVTSLTGAALEQVLSEMSGEEGVAFQNVATSSMRSFLSMLLDPSIGGRSGLGGGTGLPEIASIAGDEQLAYNGADSDVPMEHRSDRALRLWANGYGFQNTTNANAALGTHRTTATQMGGNVGLDYEPEYGNGALGVVLGISNNHWSLATSLGKGQATAYQLGVYYSRQFDGNYFAADFAYAFYNASTQRTVVLGGTNVYHANVDANSEAGSVEFGHPFEVESNSALTPYLRFAADDLGVGHYAETTVSGNPAFALSYTGKQHFDYTSELGAAFSTLIDSDSDAATALHARLGWLHDFVATLTDTATFTAFHGASFTVNGAPPAKNSAHVQLGIEHDMENIALTLNGEGAFSGSAKSYGGTASVSYRW
jgi:autotransporter-associated beta strand protein